MGFEAGTGVLLLLPAASAGRGGMISAAPKNATTSKLAAIRESGWGVVYISITFSLELTFPR